MPMKPTPSALGPTRRKPGRGAAAAATPEDRGTIVRLSRIGVVQVIRLPVDYRLDTEAVRLIRDGDRLIVEPLPKAVAPPPLPGRTASAEAGPRGRRRAPEGDGRAPSPIGPKLAR